MRKILFAILIVVIVAIAFVAGDRYGKNKTGGAGTKAERTVLYYTDPMNPGFRSEKPGTAPCGMPLEPVYAQVGDAGEQLVISGGPLQSPDAVKISQAKQQLIGVQVSPAEIQSMTYTLRLYGRIVPDETKTFRINASVDSWVRGLSDMTTGSIVKKDQILADILAPAFYNAQVTYLVTLNNIDRIQEQLSGQLRHQQREIADNQIRVAVQALQNLGITDAQIEELANTREAQPLMQLRSPATGVILDRNISLYEWFKAGDEFYRIADLDRVWVYADVYEDEAMHLRPGMEVKVRHEQSGRTYNAKIGQVLPLFDSIAKTLKVRIDVENLRYDLRPNMFVDVDIPLTMAPSLHVPADAVIDSGTRKIVYVAAGDSIFKPRRIETGWRLGRRIEITEGLMSGEKIIVSGNFLIDSESRMRTAAAGEMPVMSKDLVCGMDVNEKYAKMTGNIASYNDKTYYFCMTECREAFEKEPAKYLQGIEPGDGHHDHATMKMDRKSWLEMLEPGMGMHVAKDSGNSAEKGVDVSIGRPATFPGVVDWDGPNPKKEGEPPRDWSGWGKFPGAEYLGIQDEKKKAAAQHHDMSEPDDEMGKMEESPASDATAPHTLVPDREVLKEDQHKNHPSD
jgi:RND family efflux transporter MFP subunit